MEELSKEFRKGYAGGREDTRMAIQTGELTPEFMRKFTRMTWQIGVVLGFVIFFLLWVHWKINFFISFFASVATWWFGSAIIGMILALTLRKMIESRQNKEGKL